MRSLAVTIALIETALATSLPGQRIGCQEAINPKQLPPVSTLVDSAGTITQLATIDAPDGMLFSLVFLEGATLPLVRPLYGTDSAAAVTVANAIRPQKPSKLWGLRVRVAQGPVPSLQFERAIYCPPVPIQETRGQPRTIIVQPDPADRPPAVSGRRTFGMELRVSDEGVPINHDITQSSGLRDLDDQIVQGWLQTRFRPALLDGLPVEAVFKTGGQSPRM